MSFDNPEDLINEFKKSGEFDRLREKLLQEVAQGGGMSTLKTRVGEVAQQRFMSDPKLSFMSTDAIYKELMEEMDRFPVVDRIAEDVKLLSDPSFTENIRNSVQKILLERKEQKPLLQPDATNEGPRIVSMTPSTNRPSTEPVSGPSVVVTPATPFLGVSVSMGPPPIATQEESPVPFLEGAVETEKIAVDPASTLTDGHSNSELFLATSGADVDMVDGSQPEGATRTS